MLVAEVATYSGAASMLQCRATLSPAFWLYMISSWLFILPFWRKTGHQGSAGSKVCFNRLLEGLWSTSRNQLSHCTQNLLPLWALPRPQRKRQLSLRQKPLLEKKWSTWHLFYKLKEGWAKLRLKLRCQPQF